MRKRVIIILVLLIIFLITMMIGFINAKEKDTIVSGINYFYNGNKYEELSENDKVIYIAGLFDMFSYFEYFEFPEKYQIFTESTDGMTMIQFRKILDKYFDENPDKLHYTAASPKVYLRT